MSLIGVASFSHAIFLGGEATRKFSMSDSDLLHELARFLERIVAIARTGLAFKPDGYDAER
jgi:hypothetical protein